MAQFQAWVPPCYGSMYDDTEGTIDIITQSVYAGWKDATLEIVTGGMVADTSDATADHLTVPFAGDYLCNLSFAGAQGSSAIDITFGVNETAKAVGSVRLQVPSAMGGVSCTRILTLSANDRVSVMVANLSGTGDVTIRGVNFSVLRLS